MASDSHTCSSLCYTLTVIACYLGNTTVEERYGHHSIMVQGICSGHMNAKDDENITSTHTNSLDENMIGWS